MITIKGTVNEAVCFAKVIEEEAMFDGFYAVCTTLEDEISEIIKVNKRRWEIEESFRILKTEFKARPVYLKNDDRIKIDSEIEILIRDKKYKAKIVKKPFVEKKNTVK